MKNRRSDCGRDLSGCLSTNTFALMCDRAALDATRPGERCSTWPLNVGMEGRWGSVVTCSEDGGREAGKEEVGAVPGAG